jgi:ABC-type branched-subunit amino acid transport system substrate-binding protein
MRSTRRSALVALVLVVAVLAAACGGGKGDNNNTSSGGTTGGGGTKQLTSGPGFDGTTITLGVITPQTGPAAVIGNPLTAGNQVYWDGVNAKGGVGGKYKVKLDIRDSQYTPQVAVQAYAAMKGNVAMFQQILGTAIVNAVLNNLKTDKLVAAPASLDSFWVPEQNLLPIGAPYQIQAINALSYYVDKNGKGKKVCGLFQDDPYGEAGKEGLQFGAKELGVTLGPLATFKQGDNDFTGQLNQVKGCDAVWLTSLPTEMAKILGAAAQSNFTPQWLAQSPTFVTAFTKSALAPYLAQHYLIASDNAEWGDETVAGMKQLLADVQKYKPDQAPDGYFEFGYAQAWAVDQVLEQAVKDGDLSHDGVIKAMNSLDEVKVGGLFGDYTWGPPDKRDPPRATTMFAVDPAAPAGTKAVEKNIASDAAKAFKFEHQ